LDYATILELNSNALLPQLHKKSEARLVRQRKEGGLNLMQNITYLMSFMIVIVERNVERTSRNGRGAAEARLKDSLTP
jgi:hypothetical protein